MARRWMRGVDEALMEASRQYAVPYSTLRAIAQVESGGNPRAQTGSYQGLFQLSNDEFRRMRGQGGDIMDPRDNAMAAAALLASHQQQFERQFGRQPNLNELYMVHQQGWGGYQAHAANPDRPAWMNMASTAEGRSRGEDWAREAIAGNIPRQYLQGRDPSTITSREFMQIWNQRLSGGDTVDRSADSGYAPDPAREAPTTNVTPRAPQAPQEPEETPSARYPLAQALTGKDQPILADLFGEAGMGQNRTASNLGAALSSAGKSLARSTQGPSPGLAAIPALPDQDDRAFALPSPQRRRPPGA